MLPVILEVLALLVWDGDVPASVAVVTWDVRGTLIIGDGVETCLTGETAVTLGGLGQIAVMGVGPSLGSHIN